MPEDSSTTDIKKAPREINRRTWNKSHLEHMRRYQDRTMRFEDLSLEAQLNVECDKMAKGAVKRSMTGQLRDNKQKLPQETVYVFIVGRK